MCGPSEDALCHDKHVCQEVKRPRECPEALGIFLMDLKNNCKFRSLIQTHDLLVCDIIKMMPYNSCSQMLHISLKMEKSFITHPCCPLSVVGPEEYSAHDWWAATLVQRTPVTCRECGLCLERWPAMNTKCLVPLPFLPDLILWSTENCSHGSPMLVPPETQ